MPTLKGTETSLSCVHCFSYLVSSSISVSVFHITWLDTFRTGHIDIKNTVCVLKRLETAHTRGRQNASTLKCLLSLSGWPKLRSVAPRGGGEAVWKHMSHTRWFIGNGGDSGSISPSSVCVWLSIPLLEFTPRTTQKYMQTRGSLSFWCLPVREWLNKLCCIHTMDYSSAVEQNEEELCELIENVSRLE